MLEGELRRLTSGYDKHPDLWLFLPASRSRQCQGLLGAPPGQAGSGHRRIRKRVEPGGLRAAETIRKAAGLQEVRQPVLQDPQQAGRENCFRPAAVD